MMRLRRLSCFLDTHSLLTASQAPYWMHIPKYSFLSNTTFLETGKCFRTSICNNLVSRSICCFSICSIFPLFKLCLETKQANRVSSGCGLLKTMAYITILFLVHGKETPMENLRFSNSKYPFVKYRNKTEWYGSHFKAYFTCAVPYSNEEKLLF